LWGFEFFGKPRATLHTLHGHPWPTRDPAYPFAALHTHLRPCVFDKNNAFGGRIQQFARLNGAKTTKRRAQTMKNGLFCPPIDAKKCKTQGKNAQNWTKIRQKYYKLPCVCHKKAYFGGQNIKNVRQNLEFVPKRRAIQSKTAPKRRAARGKTTLKRRATQSKTAPKRRATRGTNNKNAGQPCSQDVRKFLLLVAKEAYLRMETLRLGWIRGGIALCEKRVLFSIKKLYFL